MPDVFISYAGGDERLAKFIRTELKSQDISVFLAGTDLIPGQDWTKAIWKNLESSSNVFILASKKSLESPFVHQEFGKALTGNKTIIPIVWNIDPKTLPDWMKRFQALDLRNLSEENKKRNITKIVNRIKANKKKQFIIASIFIVGLLLLIKSE